MQQKVTRQMLTPSWGEPECVFFEVNNRFIGTYMVQIGMYEITDVKQYLQL